MAHPHPEFPHATGRRQWSGVDVASWVVSGVALLAALLLGLLPALLAGLLMQQLARLLAGRLLVGRLRRAQGRLIAVALLLIGIVALATGAVLATIAAVHSVTSSLPAFLQRMADIIENLRIGLPASVQASMPEGSQDLKSIATAWLRDNAGVLGHFGLQATHIVVDVLVGLIIGAMVALYEVRSDVDLGPLGRALEMRAYRLGRAFRGVVFGQVRIALVNTVFTSLYLLVALPLLGIHLPLTSALVGVTFLAGLLPVLGNLVSNSAILIVSISVSPGVAIASLAFLVVIHKLEYFLNARIIGSQVHAGAWELLIAMLVMEAAFGVYGLVAAPIYYAYVKSELVAERLI